MKFDNIEQLVENTNENSDKVNSESKKVILSKTNFPEMEKYQEPKESNKELIQESNKELIQDFIHKNIETWILKGKMPQTDFIKLFSHFKLSSFKINKEIEKYCESNTKVTFLRNKVYKINTFDTKCVCFYKD